MPTKTSDPILVKVKVTTGARKESLLKISADSFVVAVCEDAKQGKANGRVLALLREHFKRGALIRMIKGHRSTSKIFSVAFHLH